jgi:hypothetical protein
VAVEAPHDLGCRMPSRLDRGFSQAGQPIERHQIADGEDLRAARQRAITATCPERVGASVIR